MTKRFLPAALATALFTFSAMSLMGQARIDTVELQKGEVLDILLISTKEDVGEDLKAYFRDAGTVAQRYSYTSLPGFRVMEHTQGNHQPQILVMGGWSDLEKREAFLDEILDEVPDFHERRRKIWSYFGLCYFELQEDLFLQINRDQYHVATALWFEDASKAEDYLKQWNKQLGRAKGEVLVQLQDGTSPKGYQFRPDFFVITTWEDETAYRRFQAKAERLDGESIRHSNELVLE
ncbi:MAG: hypothetical protein AAFQ98_23760 [Bacteroidota bacterium]